MAGVRGAGRGLRDPNAQWIRDQTQLTVGLFEYPNVHDPRSEYVERYWLPILGPSSFVVARHVADRCAAGPIVVEPIALGARFGIQLDTISNALARLIHFDMARIQGGAWQMRRQWPPLSQRYIDRLPRKLREQLDGVVADPASEPLHDTRAEERGER